MLDTRPISFLADYFVIATADNERQLKAIADDIQKQLKTQSALPIGVEGKPASGWVLLDYWERDRTLVQRRDARPLRPRTPVVSSPCCRENAVSSGAPYDNRRGCRVKIYSPGDPIPARRRG